MISLLADHNIEGQAQILWGALGADGWLDLVPMRLVQFAEIGLDFKTTDREVWRFVQAQQMILLTENRNMTGEDSLEQTIRDENNTKALPVITFGRADRLVEKQYRDRCVVRLMEILLYLENYLGTGRLFIP